MEHGSIITQARREDALVLTKQGRGATSQKLCVAPERGGGWRMRRDPGSVGPRSPVGSRTPVGAERGPGCPRSAGGCHPRSYHPSGHPSPPGPGRDSGGRAARQATRAAPTRAAEMEWSLRPRPPQRRAPAPRGPRGGHEGSRAGTTPGPEFSRRTGMPRRSGTRDEVHRPEAGAAVGEGEAGPRSPPGAGLSRFGGANEPDPRPGRSPSLPRALPRGRRCTHTHTHTHTDRKSVV